MLFWWRFAGSLIKTEHSCMLKGDKKVDIGQVVLVGGWGNEEHIFISKCYIQWLGRRQEGGGGMGDRGGERR